MLGPFNDVVGVEVGAAFFEGVGVSLTALGSSEDRTELEKETEHLALLHGRLSAVAAEREDFKSCCTDSRAEINSGSKTKDRFRLLVLSTPGGRCC